MNRHKTAVLLALLFGVPSLFAQKAEFPDFSKYPNSEKFHYFVQAHSHEYEDVRSGRPSPMLLVISLFGTSAGNSATEYLVNAAGFEMDYRNMPGWAIQASRERQLTPAQLARLKEAAANLPKTNNYPPIEQLVIVSFRQGDAWITRTCLKADVQRLINIIGERMNGTPAAE